MATPTLRALREHVGADGQLIGVMRPYVAEVLAGSRWFDDTVTYAKRPGPGESSGQQAIARLRAAKLDLVLLLTNSFRTAWLAWRSGARQRVGYRGQLRSLLLTRRFATPLNTATGLPLATLDAYLQLAASIGCPTPSRTMELATTEADEAAADAVWQRLRLPTGRDVVVFNTGGAFGSAKNWPTEHFAALAQRIVAERNLSVLVNCGPNERDTAREIVGRGRRSACGEPGGRSRATDRSHQGLHPPFSNASDHRQRAALFRHRIRSPDRDALRADRSAIGRDALRAGDLPVALAGLPALHGARLPARASSLHAGIVGGHGVRGSGETPGRGTGRISGVGNASRRREHGVRKSTRNWLRKGAKRTIVLFTSFAPRCGFARTIRLCLSSPHEEGNRERGECYEWGTPAVVGEIRSSRG